MKRYRLTMMGSNDPIILELHEEWRPMLETAVVSADIHQQSEILKNLFDIYYKRKQTTRRHEAMEKWRDIAFSLAELHSRVVKEGPITAIEEVVGDDGTQ